MFVNNSKFGFNKTFPMQMVEKCSKTLNLIFSFTQIRVCILKELTYFFESTLSQQMSLNSR